jgi:hypothetical protein
MKKKHKIADAIKYVCEKKETGTLVVVADDSQFASFSLIKGEIVSISHQGQYGVEAIESCVGIGSGVCRFHRDKVSNRRDPLPGTDDILGHFLQYSKRAVSTSGTNSVAPAAPTKEMLIDTLTIEQKRVFETCLAEYIGAMAPILAEEHLAIESRVESAVNALMMVVQDMSGMADAKTFNRHIVEQLKAAGLRNLPAL